MLLRGSVLKWILAVWLMCRALMAQDSGQINQFQAQQWQRMQEEMRRKTLGRTTVSPPEQPTLVAPEEPPADAPRIRIERIEWLGADRLPEKERREISKDFEKRDLSALDLDHLLRRLTNRYVAEGFVASRVFLPQQDLTGGVLRIQAIEGTVEKIELTQKARLGIQSAFPGLKGEILNLREIEQGLDQINRLSSRQVTMALAPGKELGGTIVQIEPGKRKWLPFSIGIDNGGLKSTGEWVVRTQAMIEQALGWNDQFALSYSFDPTARKDGHFSQAASVLGSVPYGYWTFQSGWNFTNYLNDIQNLYKSTGNTHGGYLGVNRLLYRNQKLKWQTGVQISYQDSVNYIDDIRLITGSRQLSSLKWTSDVSFYGTGWQGSAGVGVEQGVNWFGARSDTERTRDDEPYAEGQIYTFDLNGQFLWPSDSPFGAWIWNSSLRAQYALQRLFSSQQVSLGGAATVRGFREESVLADAAVYWRNDWSCAGFDVDRWTRGLFSKASPYVFCDVGQAFGPGVESPEQCVIAGASPGFRFSGKSLLLDAYLAFPLTEPDRIRNPREIGFFSLRYSF